ncbi:hypothetical protein ZHAS_00006129 [Anopheles sinensis]|uniref:Protein osiris 7 n=1 Tax=Anopheles sinensis TaxID=74873 RepID=A0A084VL87_ANOSI|nr:hypothetical protein ZHAS_00006129 [Anopheles sinensis]
MAFAYKVVVGVLCLAALAVALPADEARSSHNSISGVDSDLFGSISKECASSDSLTCVKRKLFTFFDRVIAKRSVFSLTEGVTVVKTPGAAAETEGAPRALTGDESLEQLILSRVQSFLSSHTIKVDLKGADIVNAVTSTGRALEDVSENLLDEEEGTGEARGKKKKAAKILGPLLLAVALKAAALLPLLLGAIALIAGKALLIGKIALVLSAIIGLKKLLSQEKHVTYEVVAHPHHSTSHTSSHGDAYSLGGSYGGGDVGGYSASSGHGGWSRSIKDAQDIAYNGQKP